MKAGSQASVMTDCAGTAQPLTGMCKGDRVTHGYYHGYTLQGSTAGGQADVRKARQKVTECDGLWTEPQLQGQ
jgi:hypothetical protein